MWNGNYVPEVTPTTTGSELLLRLRRIDHQERWAPNPSSGSIVDIGDYIMGPATGDGEDGASHGHATAADAIHGLGDEGADLLVAIGGDGGDLGDFLRGLDRLR